MTVMARLVLCALVVSSAWAQAESAVVLFEGKTIDVGKTLKDPNDLWVTPEDLTRINGFVMKPQGACLDDICIPVNNDTNFVVTRKGQQWVNATELARKLNQAYVADAKTNVWSFAPIPATFASYLDSAIAPDFELKDRDGNVVRLSDFRGKKVLLGTWASW